MKKHKKYSTEEEELYRKDIPEEIYKSHPKNNYKNKMNNDNPIKKDKKFEIFRETGNNKKDNEGNGNKPDLQKNDNSKSERKKGDFPKRSPLEKFGSSNETNTRMGEISDKLRKGIRKAKGEGKNGERIGIQDEKDIESRIAFEFAKENDLWFSNIYKFGVPFSSGNENTVVLNIEEGLYKSNNLLNSKTIINLIDRIDIHNKLFPETRYEFVGFTGIDNGKNHSPYVEVIFKQHLADFTTVANPKEIVNYMTSIGFKEVNKTSFTNGVYEVSDLYPRNVLKDENGVIYVVDAEIKETLTEKFHKTPKVFICGPGGCEAYKLDSKNNKKI